MSTDKENPILQACAIPYRKTDGRAEFCLITSIKKGRWGFPKGIIDPGETAEETALKEAHEEAGIRGRIEGDPLGEYEYRKWGTVLWVTAYLMRVTATDDDWVEAHLRNREWCSAEEARAAINREELIALLDTAVERVSG